MYSQKFCEGRSCQVKEIWPVLQTLASSSALPPFLENPQSSKPYEDVMCLGCGLVCQKVSFSVCSTFTLRVSLCVLDVSPGSGHCPSRIPGPVTLHLLFCGYVVGSGI